jgi:hypothetical protein
MIEPRSGVWWMDADPDRQLPGTLSRVGDVWRLDLIGSLGQVDRGGPDGLALVPPTTIFGSCLGTRYTLGHAFYKQLRSRRLFDSEPENANCAKHQKVERWSAYTLLEGGAYSEKTRYEAAQFELTGLSDWWPHTGLRGEAPRESEYVEPEGTQAQCGEGLVVTIGTTISQSWGTRRRIFSEHVKVWVEQESGFTLTDLIARVIIPLRALVSVCLHRPIKYFNLALRPLNTSSDEQALAEYGYPVEVDPDVVDVEAELKPYRYGYWPALTAETVELATTIPGWLRFGGNYPVPLFVAEHRNDHGPLQTEVVQAVNAAETLHRALHPDPELPFTAKVEAALSAANALKLT